MRRRALVTGGAVRVGQAIALALARAGMDAAIGYHRSGRAARRAAAEIGALGARATVIRANTNSATVFDRTPFATTTVARYDRLPGLNLRAAFFCAQAAAALMRRGGHISNIGDAGAAGPRPNYIPYTLAKAGIESLTRGLAVTLRSQRIAVNCVAPGAVLRPPRFSPARWRKVTRGHAGSAADVAAAVLFFATCPRYITGQVLKVDGGEGVTS